MNKRVFSTVNQAELKKFAAIGKQWWNTSSFDGASPLHDMNPVRVSFIRDCVATKLSKENNFDLGKYNSAIRYATLFAKGIIF